MLRLDGPPAWHRRCAERRAGRALYGPGLVYPGSSVTAVKHNSEQRDLSSKNYEPRLLFAENGLRFAAAATTTAEIFFDVIEQGLGTRQPTSS